jgi:hypothetical protein
MEATILQGLEIAARGIRNPVRSENRVKKVKLLLYLSN